MNTDKLNALDPRIEWPKYQSHKIVEALKIKRVTYNTDEIPHYVVTFEDERFAPACYDANVFTRGTPSSGDYMVRYEDGYTSWSPAAFDGGYTRLGVMTEKRVRAITEYGESK